MRLFNPKLVRTRFLIVFPLLLILLLMRTQNAHAVTTETLNCSSEYQIVKTFANQTKWEMCWEPRAGYGYRLTQVIFTPTHGIRRKVLESMHAAQLFVPYDDNSARFHDIAFGNNLSVLTSAECPNGVLLTNSSLCLTHRSAGYSYKNVSTGNSKQSESFEVFGYFSLGNYYYTFKYTFFDDGSIEPAVLASGSLQRYSGTQLTGWPVGNQVAVNHNHLVIWRLDFDLDGSANNLVEQVEFGGSGTDNRNMVVRPLSSAPLGQPAKEVKTTNNLNSMRFWRIRNTAQNNNDSRNISYEIEPSVTDLLRAPEDFTQNDLYLTEYHPGEDLVDTGLVGFVNGEIVKDPVLWYGVNFHHVPRGEDDIKMPSHSQGFRIRPRDITTAVAPAGNTPPVVTNPGTQSSESNTPVNLQISASDVNGDTLSYSASGLPTGLSIDSATGLISGTTPVTPVSANVTVTVNDGHPGGNSSINFSWIVTGAGTGTQAFTSPGAINIRDKTTALPYPASVNINGVSGVVTKVTLTLNGLSHSCGRDIDILLVGPSGQKTMLMSDAGSCLPINNANVTFDSAATSVIPATTSITTGTYQPANYAIGGSDIFPAPAPTSTTPYPANLAVFNGISPNGAWNVYVVDDTGGDVGQIANGLTLNITTVPPGPNASPVIVKPGTQNSPLNTNVNLQVSASDANGDTLSYSATGLPTGLSIDSATGIISGTTPSSAVTKTVTITVSDGHPGGISNTSFDWVVTAGAPGVQTFSNPAGVTIRDLNTANPYPVTINVSGISENIDNVTVTLNGLTHTCGRDIDIILVGPGGQRAMLMSDAGACLAINNANVTFDAASALTLPQSSAITTGKYRAVDYAVGPVDKFPAPGPVAPFTADLTVFNGTSPNGNWNLYVYDDAGGDSGQIVNGVSLTITPEPPLDNIPPTVSANTPANGANDIAVATSVTAIFSEQMTPESVSTSSFTLQGPNGLVSATVNYNEANFTARLMPKNDLAPNTTYTATLISGANGVKDIVGNVLQADVSWTFTTVASETVPPTVNVKTPADAANGIALNIDVTAVFSESMASTSIANSTFTLSGPNGLIPVTVSYNDSNFTAKLTPKNELANNTLYTATIKSGADGVKDLAGNALQNDVSWTFTTVRSEIIPPIINVKTPADAATGIALNTDVNVVFSESMAPSSISNATFMLNGPNGVVPAVVSYDAASFTAKLIPENPLTPDTSYSTTVKGGVSGVKDLAGNELQNDVTWTFITKSPEPQVHVYSAPGAITIADLAKADPYPANINVTGLSGNISKVAVALNGLSHTYPADIDILLVGPGDRKAMLMSDAGGGADINGFDITFDSTAASALPLNGAISAGLYKPTNYDSGPTDNFPAPGPADPYPADLTVFNGISPNGNWSVYFLDDAGNDAGQILNGITLTITLAASGDTTRPTIVSKSPVDGATNIGVGSSLTTVFSEAMTSASISASSFTLQGPNGLIPASVSFNSSNLTATLTPSSVLEANTTYTATVKGGTDGTKDLSGNELLADVSWSFTTLASQLGTQTFSAPASIALNDKSTASPYPIPINVSGLTGTVSKVSLTLNGLTHAYPADIDILLEGPSGQKALLMSDAGGGADVNNIVLSFDAASILALPENDTLVSGAYLPGNFSNGTPDSFLSPAPSAPYVTDLNIFNETSPNGTWNLYIIDEVGGDDGEISGGVALTITTN